jgi:hypothetical protein
MLMLASVRLHSAPEGAGGCVCRRQQCELRMLCAAYMQHGRCIGRSTTGTHTDVARLQS